MQISFDTGFPGSLKDEAQVRYRVEKNNPDATFELKV